MVFYPIEALVAAGRRRAHARHRRHHAGEFLRLLGNGHEFGFDALFYAYQEQPGGIAEALGLAERSSTATRRRHARATTSSSARSRRTSRTSRPSARRARVLLTEMDDPEHLRHLGVPELDGEDDRRRIVEKPDEPPSRYAVTGIYFYDPAVLDVLPTLEPSGPRRARDHRRQQLVRRARRDGVRRASTDSGATPASRSTCTTRSTTSCARTGRTSDTAPVSRCGYRGRPRMVHGSLSRACCRRPSSGEPRLLPEGRHPRAALPRARPGRPLRVRQRHGARRRARSRHGRDVHEDIGDDNPVALYIPGHLAHGYEALTDCSSVTT